MSTRDLEGEITAWIHRCAWETIEGEGDLVGTRPELVEHVIACYRRSATVEQRAAAMRLLPDRFEPAWDAIRRDFLQLARPERQGPVHVALCVVLAALDRNWSRHDLYWDDLDAAMARAGELAAAEHAGAGEPELLPSHGFTWLHRGMRRADVERALGPPSVEEDFADLDEVELRYDQRGIVLQLAAGAVDSILLRGPALGAELRIRHASRPDATIGVPASMDALIAAWGEPRHRTTSRYERPFTVNLLYAGTSFRFVESTGALHEIGV